VHFHALIRLDAIDPTDPDAILAPPDGITAADLVELVADATATAGFRTPDYADTTHSWPVHWGPQVDIRPLGLAGGQIISEAVAAYLAKYATKAIEPTGMPITAPMTAEAAEHFSDPDTRLDRLIAYAFQLGTRPRGWNTDQQKDDRHDIWARLRRWTHMLVFGGHFATKSRRYSTTHKVLRADRRSWRRTQQNWRQRHREEPRDRDRRDDTGRLRSHPASAGTPRPTPNSPPTPPPAPVNTVPCLAKSGAQLDRQQPRKEHNSHDRQGVVPHSGSHEPPLALSQRDLRTAALWPAPLGPCRPYPAHPGCRDR
jgi:hypothetical protein